MAGTVILDTVAHSEYSSVPVSSRTISLTTNGANRFAVIQVVSITGTARSVSSISGGGTWTRRDNTLLGVETWTCPLAAQQTAVTVTVTLSGTSAQIELLLATFYVSGSGYLPIFDALTATYFSSAGLTKTSTVTTTLDNTTGIGLIYANQGSGLSLGLVAPTVATGFSSVQQTAWNSSSDEQCCSIADADTVSIGSTITASFTSGTANNMTSGIVTVISLQGIPTVTTIIPPTSPTYVYVPGVNGNPGYMQLTWTPPVGYTGTGYCVYRISDAELLQGNGIPRREAYSRPFATVAWGTNIFLDRDCEYPPKLFGQNTYKCYVTTVNDSVSPFQESVYSAASNTATFLG